MVKVSIIIPIYNSEKYIEKCLNSIIKQTLKDIEIILVNDGSTDKSLSILKSYAKKDKRIKLIDKENGGLASARNAGINASCGKYIYFIDSDDFIEINALEILYNKMEDSNLDTLFFDATSIFGNENLAKANSSFNNYYTRQHSYDGVYSGQELFKLFSENKEYRTSACLQINRTSFLKKHNINFLEGIIHEDEYFTLLVCIFSQRASYINNQLYKRLIRNDSIMTSSNALKRSYGYLKVLTSIKPYIEEYVDNKYLDTFTSYLLELENSSVKFLREVEKNDQHNFNKILDKYKNDLSINEFTNFHLMINRNRIYLNQIDKLKKELQKQNNNKNLIMRSFNDKIINFKSWFRKKFTSNIYISIIMPVYNCAKYLPACLDSLLKQSLGEIEIICIDDSSTDRSYDILCKYQKQYPIIKVYKQKHSNAGDARNIGIKHAKGKFLLFLDSDDFFEKDLCKKAYHYANYYNTDILLFGAYKYDEKVGKKKNILQC